MIGSRASNLAPDPGPGQDGSAAGAETETAWYRRSSLWVAGLIAVATLLALALRFYQLTRPGFLLSVTEYDDGPYFGSAVRLVHGQLPYRDFLFVQPPGITLLMIPAALLSKITGTAWGMASGRILTALAGAAATALAGLLVRHRGILAVLIACGVTAVFPDGLRAAHTVLVEPWLVLFCLLGALAVFDRDQLTTSSRRLVWGGAAFGFAGAVEPWAIVPVLVIGALYLRTPGRLLRYAAGVAAGFLIPVVPFAVLAPHGFFQGLVTAQVGGRAGAHRIGLLYRVQQMTGLSQIPLTHQQLMYGAAVAEAIVIVAGLAAAALRGSRHLPSALEVFVTATTILIVAVFLWPSQFHYHFSAFLAPFLGLALGLAAAALLTPGPSLSRPARTTATALAGLVACLAVAGTLGTAVELARWLRDTPPPHVPMTNIEALQRVVPRGACVVTDLVSYAIMADRFVSDVPGCPLMLDPTGVDLGLAHGLTPRTGAARVPALVAVWRYSFAHGQYVYLSNKADNRIPWTPGLRAYFKAHFTPALSFGPQGGQLYKRTSS